MRMAMVAISMELVMTVRGRLRVYKMPQFTLSYSLNKTVR